MAAESGPSSSIPPLPLITALFLVLDAGGVWNSPWNLPPLLLPLPVKCSSCLGLCALHSALTSHSGLTTFLIR